MGLADELDYRHGTGNPLHRAMRWFGGTRPGAWIFSRSLRHLDDAIGRISRGRQSAPGLLAGLAVLDLATTGRKSGQRRTSHLIATPIDGTLGLIGSNFGQENTPAWVVNLEADPRASVTYRGVTREVVARPASDADATRVIETAGTFYRGYLHYRERIGSSRRLRVFLLDPVSGA